MEFKKLAALTACTPDLGSVSAVAVFDGGCHPGTNRHTVEIKLKTMRATDNGLKAPVPSLKMYHFSGLVKDNKERIDECRWHRQLQPGWAVWPKDQHCLTNRPSVD